MMTNDLNKERIRWCCRRGMLELDLILGSFFEQHFEKLPPDMQQLFVEFLDCDDPDIYAWLMDMAEPKDKFRSLIATIKMSAANARI